MNVDKDYNEGIMPTYKRNEGFDSKQSNAISEAEVQNGRILNEVKFT
jgi:hypothetical protein